MTTPRLGAPELVVAQDVPETTVNEQISFVEQGATRFLVIDKDLATPPGSPVDGACYIVASSPTGAWSGWSTRVAFYRSGWKSIVPQEGMRAYVQDENAEYKFDGSAWSSIPDAGIAVEEDGSSEGTGILSLNFTTGLDVSVAGTEATISVTGGANTIAVEDEGSELSATVGRLNFTGAGVSVSETGGEATVTISGSAGGSFRGALVTKSADQTTADYSTAAQITWNSETGGYDTDSIHDNSTNPSRLTVPSGVTKVKVGCAISISNAATNSYGFLSIIKNGNASDEWIGRPWSLPSASGDVNLRSTIWSAVVTVSSGDYFEARLSIVNDTSVTLEANASWFAMEIIE